MAPALTEPLSPNNTLTASTSSASPRPSISQTATNSLLRNNNHNIKNGSTGNNKNNKPSSSQPTAATTDTLLNGHNNNINTSHKNFGIIENSNNNYNNNSNLQKNNLFRRSLTSTCAFQSAFEESILKAGISLPPEQPSNKKNKKSNSIVVQSIVVKAASSEGQKQGRSNSPNENFRIKDNTLRTPTVGSKENLSNNFVKKVKTEPLYNQQSNINNNKISPKSNSNFGSSSGNNSSNSNNIGKLTTNGPSSLLSTSSIVCKSIEAKTTSATTSKRSNKTDKLTGSMSNKTQKDTRDFIIVSKDKKSTVQQSEQHKNKQGFIPIDKNFEEIIHNTLEINCSKKRENSKQDQRQKREKNEIKTLLRIEDLKQMDLPKRSDNNENIVNINDKTIVLRDNIEKIPDSNFLINKRVVEIDTCGNIVSGVSTCFDKDAEDSVIIECDSRNQQPDIEFSQQEIRSTGTTDTTVSASEGENNFLEENFQDSSHTICPRQESTPNRLSNQRSPPKTPITSSQHLSQIIVTPVSSILTPQSIGLSSSTMGLQKDFKDSEIDDQVISDMDLLQVLKGLDPTTGGDNLCDLAGNLGLFNDVDVMNYEEIVVPSLKEPDTTLDTKCSTEKFHQQMERKCEHLLRRLRKLQSRYMAKHISQEVSGLFEWTNRLVRRKDQHEQIPSLSYEEDKHRPVSATAMKNLLRKIDLVAKAQHSNSSDLSSQPLKKYKCTSRSTSSSLINSNLLGRDHHDKKGSSNSNSTSNNISATIIKSFDEKTAEEIGYVSGLLHSEVHQTQYAFDSDATASSSGGESADEMVPCNNQSQQSLSISKRAGWKWARDRGAIASRWTWLCTQISDLEYKIRQHNELYQQIRKNKGVVQFEIPNTKHSKEKKQLDTVTITKLNTEKSVKTDSSENGNIITLNSDNIIINSTNNVNGYRGVIAGVNSTNHNIENKHRNNNNINSSNDNNNNSNNNNISNNNIINIKENKVHQIDESGDTSAITEDEEDDMLGACRTRPFQRTGFRKRKLLQTANVHTVSKKAARPSFHCSTVKCGCQWPFNPCALCTGRPDPTAPRDLPDTMMLAERIALLDPGFHPVLSFTEDVPTNVHIEAILHMPEWQNKLIRSVSKNSKSSNRKSETSHGGHSKNSGSAGSKRPYNKSSQKYRKDGSTTPSTNKTKKSRKNHDYPSEFSHHSEIAQSPQNSLNSSTKNKHRKSSSGTMISSSLPLNSTTFVSNNTGSSSGNKVNSSFSALNSSATSSINGFQSAFAESLINSFQCDNLDGSSNGVLPRSKNTSPTPVSGTNYKYERLLERKNRNSYDIDNIVIPYSVAASTRVELLPYKEIPTPKWRVIDDDAEKTENKTYEINKDIENDLEVSKNKIIDFLENKYDSNTDIELESITKVVFKDNESRNTIESQDDLDQNDFSFTVNEVDEDISIEAIQSRHDRALLEERKKFSTYLKFPWSTRSRANRRIDSRAESSGANTPDPTSPAPHTPSAGGDQESIPSPAAPSTPLAIQGESGDGDLLNSPFGHRRERKRTVSSKKDKDVYGVTSSADRRSQSPDLKEMIPPYEPLNFPISDDIFEKMLELMPNNNNDDDNSNLISDIGGNNSSNNGNNLSSFNTENINKKLNDSNYGSRKNSNSLNLSDTFNDNNNSCLFVSSTSTDINELCRNNNSNRNSLSENSINNNNNNKNIYKKKSILKMGSSSFHEYFDSNDKIFLLPGDSDTDSVESALDDPNDPEWKQPE